MKVDKKKLNKQLFTQLRDGEVKIGTDAWSEGEYIVKEVFSPNFATGAYADATIYNIPMGYSDLKLPAGATDTVGGAASGNIDFGITTYWVDEAATITTTKAQFYNVAIDTEKVVALVPATMELCEDTMDYYRQFINKNVPKALTRKISRAMFYDSTLGDVAGVLSGSTQSTYFSPETNFNDRAADMVIHFYGAGNPEASGKWYLGRGAYDSFIQNFAYDAGGRFLEAVDENTNIGYLYGFPMVVADYLEGDTFVLGDFSQYIIGQKEMREAMSESLYFVTDQKAIRSIVELGGRSSWNGPALGADGVEIYPFCTFQGA